MGPKRGPGRSLPHPPPLIRWGHRGDGEGIHRPSSRPRLVSSFNVSRARGAGVGGRRSLLVRVPTYPRLVAQLACVREPERCS